MLCALDCVTYWLVFSNAVWKDDLIFFFPPSPSILLCVICFHQTTMRCCIIYSALLGGSLPLPVCLLCFDCGCCISELFAAVHSPLIRLMLLFLVCLLLLQWFLTLAFSGETEGDGKRNGLTWICYCSAVQPGQLRKSCFRLIFI